MKIFFFIIRILQFCTDDKNKNVTNLKSNNVKIEIYNKIKKHLTYKQINM